MRTNHPNYRTFLVFWIYKDAALARFVHLVNIAVRTVRLGMGRSTHKAYPFSALAIDFS
jgi:hypothetical protein